MNELNNYCLSYISFVALVIDISTIAFDWRI